MFQLTKNLQRIKLELKNLHRDHYVNIHTNIKESSAYLTELQSKLQLDRHIQFLIKAEKEAILTLWKYLKAERSYYR